MRRGDMVLLATRSMEDYAERVAYQLETFPDFHERYRGRRIIGDLKTVHFADGEMEVEVHTSLRGKDVFLLANSGRNSRSLSVTENKIELYHTIDAVRRVAASRLVLVEPYVSSSRSDRTTRRNSVGFWVHYKTLQSLGVDHIITYQLHSDKSRSVVDPTLCAIDDVPAMPLLMEYLTETFVRDSENLYSEVRDRWLFCSVDAGGESVVRNWAMAFGTRLIIAHKQRDYKQANTVQSINILSDTEIRGKEVWIVDDMVDTAGSVYALVKELRKRGVGKVNVAAVHAVFSGEAVDRLRELHDEQLLNHVIVTDTIDVPDELRTRLPFLHVVSSARLSAEIIMRLHEEQSLSPFFDPFNPAQYLNSLKLFL